MMHKRTKACAITPKVRQEVEERWKDIAGYEGMYQISDHGNVKRISDDAQHVMKPHVVRGHYAVILYRNGQPKHCYIHRLVASAFLEKPEGCSVVNHLDFDPSNNHVGNLEWCTQKYNVQYSRERMKKPKSKDIRQKGEKYIRFHSGGYGVCIRLNGFRYFKQFKTLEEAIKARDKVMKEYELQKQKIEGVCDNAKG